MHKLDIDIDISSETCLNSQDGGLGPYCLKSLEVYLLIRQLKSHIYIKKLIFALFGTKSMCVNLYI